MATIPVPTLSTAGWVTSRSEKADFLMSHWYEADKSQTYLFGANVASLAYILEQNATSPVDTCAAIRSELERYLGAYYPEGVTVQATTKDLPTDADPLVNIDLYIEVTEAGQVYSLGQQLQITNSRLSKVVKLNNDGTAP